VLFSRSGRPVRLHRRWIQRVTPPGLPPR
jgi:hypothetical protein